MIQNFLNELARDCQPSYKELMEGIADYYADREYLSEKQFKAICRAANSQHKTIPSELIESYRQTIYETIQINNKKIEDFTSKLSDLVAKNQSEIRKLEEITTLTTVEPSKINDQPTESHLLTKLGLLMGQNREATL